jgi:hypothetical protein
MAESQPTSDDYERAQGRLALWLDPNDIKWLSKHCWCSDNVGEHEKKRCARLRFRAMAALHKAGLGPKPENQEDGSI